MRQRFQVCVVGAGPAGLGFAQEWIRDHEPSGLVIIEAGVRASARFCTVHRLKGCRKVDPCQVTSGVGGASGLAGGKLSEYPAGRGLSRLMGDGVEKELQRALDRLGSKVALIEPALDLEGLRDAEQIFENLKYELRHYKANKYAQADLSGAWETISEELVSKGVTLRTETEALAVRATERGFEISARHDEVTSSVQASAVVVATGRTGASVTRSLGSTGSRHPLDVGVRIEFPASAWPDLDAVHGDLKLHFDNARTFCTSKSGWVSPYRHEDFMLLEGRTDQAEKSPWSNLAITIRTDEPAEDVVGFVRQAVLAQGPGSTIRQSLSSYLADEAEASPDGRLPAASFNYWRWGDVNALFPPAIARELRKAIERFASEVLPITAAEQAFVFGPELDYYWPTLDHRVVSPGVWSAGDVTGDYRGTLQAYAAGAYLTHEVAEFVAKEGRLLGQVNP